MDEYSGDGIVGNEIAGEEVAGNEMWEVRKLFNIYILILDEFAGCYSISKHFAKIQ